jgi:hypothetical protein
VCLLCGRNWVSMAIVQVLVSVAVLWVTGLLPSMLGFKPRSVRVRFEVATKWHFPGTSVFPCEYHSTSATYLFLSTARNFPQALLFRKLSSTGQQSAFTAVVFDGESREIRVFPRDEMLLLC